MRSLFYIFSALAVIGLAYWAYHENYRTQAVQAEAEKLQRDISLARQRLRVLNAEWAYLNRPDRLRDLTALNFETLGLLEFQPHQFGKVDQVGFPPRVVPGNRPLITNPVDVSEQSVQSGQEDYP